MKTRAALWVVAAFGVVAFPFLVLLAGQPAPGTGFLWDFSKGLGFGALAVAGLQFALTARFRTIAHPFGIDILYLFHRYLALGTLALMLAHFGILYIWFEEALGDLNPLTARWELTAGRLSLVCFALLVITSEFRKRLRLEYGWWRTMHVVLAIAAFAAAIAHVLGVGHFTASEDKRALILGISASWLLLILWVRMIKPAQQIRNPWRVVENIPERGGVHTLILEPVGKPLKNWKPGQFAWLTIGHSPYGLREHPFTMSNAPESGPKIALSIKPLGDFTEEAVKTAPGTRAWIDGPYGAFSTLMEPDTKGFVMIAGGIGITPMISNLRSMCALGDKRPAILIYANDDWDGITFREELEALEQHMELTILHVIETPPEDWTGETGFVDREMLERLLPVRTREWSHMLCGPPAMTEAVRQALLESGVSVRLIDSEIFDLV